MLRKTFIIDKEKIFRILQREDVVKIEIAKSKNKTLRNARICKIHVYFTINYLNLFNLIGNCKVIAKKRELKSKGILTGIASCKTAGFIRESTVLKLKQFEESSGINLHIPKELLSFQNISL